jgi:glycosyltransferase involved in cell wall biosynthesis
VSTFPPEPEHAPPEYAPHVSIVLPCFNEEEHVLLEIERICIAMDKSGLSYELLAIDDGSTDQTLARLCRAEPDFPNLKVIPFRRNSGAGTVRRIGTQQARGDIVVWTDADLTYPNERIPEFAAILDEDPRSTRWWARAPARKARSRSSACPPNGSCASWPNGSPTPTSRT